MTKDKLIDYIKVYENIIDDQLISLVHKEFILSDDWQNAAVRSGVNTDVRNCSVINLSEQQIIQKNVVSRSAIDNQIFSGVAKVIRKYRGAFPDCSIEEDSGYNLLRYETGQFYTKHTDHFKNVPRSVSCSFLLNDGYEGGEFSFFDGSYKVKPPKGSAIVFPSNFMYPHEVLPVTNGVRYSIVTWFV